MCIYNNNFFFQLHRSKNVYTSNVFYAFELNAFNSFEETGNSIENVSNGKLKTNSTLVCILTYTYVVVEKKNYF
jgi:hypothetical protein